MADQSWYFAADGKQQGPYSDDQLQAFVANGTVRADTLVWRAGMAAWEKAAQVPGLMGTMPPALAGTMGGNDGALTTDFTTFGLFGRVLLFVIGTFVIIPAPWVAHIMYSWGIPRIHVPGRPNLGFTGKPLDIWYVFMLNGLLAYGGIVDWWVPYLLIPVNGFLAWMVIRWVVGNISSNGQPLALGFAGSPWVYIGWFVLLYVSFITIIGWAWVTTAWMRWLCRNIAGTRRAVVFNGSGWGVLWRTFAFVLACFVIIPIPWVLKWLANWYISQVAVVDRASLAEAQ